MSQEHRPPGPGKSLWRETLRLRRIGPHAFIRSLVERYGDFALVEIGQFQAYLISDPDLIHEILTTHADQTTKGRETKRLIPYLGQGLLTSEGTVHRQQRKMLNPAFHRTVLTTFASMMAQYAQDVTADWHDGAVINGSQMLGRLTMAIATKTLLDLDLDVADARTLATDLRTTLRIYTTYLGLPFDWLIRMRFLPPTRRYYAAMHRLNTLLFARIAARRDAARGQNDLLALLLAAHGGEQEDQELTAPEVRDQIMTFFFAGHETLSSALPWGWWHVARSPEIGERLAAEVDQVLGGRMPTAEDLPQLVYTTQIVRETLRLYPPIIALSRRVEVPFALTGYSLPIGAHLYMSQFAVHRDPRWWPKPEHFQPERFAPGATPPARYAYFPFGAGERQCIGEGFALLEGVITLATIAQRWRFSPMQDTLPSFGNSIITLRPKQDLWFRVQRRSGTGSGTI